MQFTGIKKQAARHPAKHGRRSGRIRRPFRRKFWNINGTETTIIANDYLYGFHSHRDCHDSTLPVAPAPFAGSFPPIRKTPAEGVRARQPARARRAMPATARDGLHGRQPGRRDRLAARLGRTARQAVRIPYGTRHPDRAAEKREGLSAESVARKGWPAGSPPPAGKRAAASSTATPTNCCDGSAASRAASFPCGASSTRPCTSRDATIPMCSRTA